jgi:hypothetical protein
MNNRPRLSSVTWRTSCGVIAVVTALIPVVHRQPTDVKDAPCACSRRWAEEEPESFECISSRELIVPQTLLATADEVVENAHEVIENTHGAIEYADEMV